jgi:CRP-like cAMP-binding protein
MAWKHAMTESFDTTPLIRKLETHLVLSDDERNALQSISGTVKTFGARQDIVCEGDRPSACCLLLEGFLCRYKLTDDGKRQILSFHIAGDIPMSGGAIVYHLAGRGSGVMGPDRS